MRANRVNMGRTDFGRQVESVNGNVAVLRIPIETFVGIVVAEVLKEQVMLDCGDAGFSRFEHTGGKSSTNWRNCLSNASTSSNRAGSCNLLNK